MMKEKLIEELKKFPLLQELSDEDMKVFAGILREENFKEGKRIIEEGDLGNCMYLLLEGAVDVLKTTLYGEEYVCAKLNDTMHCVFGEIALIDHDKRSASILATRDCRTAVVTVSDFQTFCQERPAAGCKLLMVISSNLCRNLRLENENLLKVYSALVEEIENVK